MDALFENLPRRLEHLALDLETYDCSRLSPILESVVNNIHARMPELREITIVGRSPHELVFLGEVDFAMLQTVFTNENILFSSLAWREKKARDMIVI